MLSASESWAATAKADIATTLKEKPASIFSERWKRLNETTNDKHEVRLILNNEVASKAMVIISLSGHPYLKSTTRQQIASRVQDSRSFVWD